MVTISELFQGCLAQFISLINSDVLSDYTEEVPLQEWRDELGRFRVWAANIGAHQTRQSSLDYRLRDASHIKSQIVRLLKRVQELLTDLKDVLEEKNDDEAQDDRVEDLGDISESENSTTEIQEIQQGLVETITQLYQMSMIIRKPAQHDRLVGTDKLDSEPFKFWAQQHTSNKYPNADALVIDRISSAMARQRAILKYRERHHTKLSQGINSESDGKSTMLSETVVTDVFKETPGQFSDMVSDTGISETSYGGTLLEGTGADAPKIPPIPKKGAEQRPFECPYCFYIITARDKRAWARHIFRDLMPYVCIFPGCSTPNKLYEGRRQWYHHIRQAHASTSSTDDIYDCSICKQSSLPAATFQRHVGQHLEELALFLLPRTDEDEDENAETDEEKGVGSIDENLSDASLDKFSAEQSVEQRNDMNHAATPASDSGPGEDYPLGGLQNKSKHYPSSVGTNLSDRESPGALEPSVEYKRRGSSTPSNSEYEPGMSQKLLGESDFRQDVEIWKQQQGMEPVEGEMESHGPAETKPFLSRKPGLKRSELDMVTESRGHMKKLEEAEKAAAERDELKAKILEEKLKELAEQPEEQEHDKLKEMVEEERREATEAEEKKKRELLIEEWKLEQERIKQKQKEEAEKKDNEFRERLRIDFGCTEEEIEELLYKQKNDVKEKHNEHEVKEKLDTWIKVHRKHVLPETLMAFDLPWQWDEHDSNYIIIKQWVPEDFQGELFAHTRRVRREQALPPELQLDRRTQGQRRL